MTRRGLPVFFWTVVVGSLLAHNVYLWVGERIHPDTDILALLPAERRDPALEQASVKMVDAAEQRLVALIGAPDWAGARRAADAYREVLARHGDLFQLNNQAGERMAPIASPSLSAPALQALRRVRPRYARLPRAVRCRSGFITASRS